MMPLRRKAEPRDRADPRRRRRRLPLPPPGGDGAGPVRMKMGADGMPQLPPGMGKNGLMMMMMNGRLRMVGNGQPVSALTEMLGNQLGRPVVDATELKAKYDFTLDFTPENMSGPMGMMPPPRSMRADRAAAVRWRVRRKRAPRSSPRYRNRWD